MVLYKIWTYFWSSGKYKSASKDGSVKAVSEITKAFLPARKPPSRSPFLRIFVAVCMSSRAFLIWLLTSFVITMLLILSSNSANDCKVSFASVTCSTERTRSNPSNSQSRIFRFLSGATVTSWIFSCKIIYVVLIFFLFYWQIQAIISKITHQNWDT